MGKGIPKRDVDRVLAITGLEDAATEKVRSYSQGMRQRLGLALALARKPRLLILDEPANGLDPAGIRELRQLIRDLADQGCTIFLSSHQLAEVEKTCDRVAVMDKGRLIAVESLAQVGSSQGIFVVEVQQAEEERALAVLRHSMVGATGTGQLVVRASSGREVTECLGSQGIYPSSVSAARSSLEERFPGLTRGETELIRMVVKEITKLLRPLLLWCAIAATGLCVGMAWLVQ
ncbi:MAG TPA: AAA family ATPase [Actinomycetota bacterium]|jgi:ABC-2 type transport system ATP-binding protein|nr:AAA family ATPase [Actinomycetota bacterium]